MLVGDFGVFGLCGFLIWIFQQHIARFFASTHRICSEIGNHLIHFSKVLFFIQDFLIFLVNKPIP